jgi:hypothetical protein
MEFKLIGFKSKFIYIRCGAPNLHFTSQNMEDILDVAQKHKMSAEDLSKFPLLNAIEFKEESGRDDEYVFLLEADCLDYLDGEDRKIYFDEWTKAIQRSLSDTSKEEYPILICSHDCKLRRIKKVLLPFL